MQFDFTNIYEKLSCRKKVAEFECGIVLGWRNFILPIYSMVNCKLY